MNLELRSVSNLSNSFAGVVISTDMSVIPWGVPDRQSCGTLPRKDM